MTEEREVTLVHDESGLTHFVEVGDPIGGGTAMCGKLGVRLQPGEGTRGTCMWCRDARRRLNPDGSYKPTLRPGDYGWTSSR